MALKLSTFSLADPIVDPTLGRATVAYLTWINGVVRSIQSTVNDLSQFANDIAFSVEQAGIAIKTAQQAQATADANSKATSLANSYVSPTNVLSAMLSGATATITVADHSRIYGDGTIVAIKGGLISGLDTNTSYFVVYQDAGHKGGTVTFTVTKDSTAAGQTGAQHLVGSITTPTVGSTAPSNGSTTQPPGVGSLAQQKRDAANGGGDTVIE